MKAAKNITWTYRPIHRIAQHPQENTVLFVTDEYLFRMSTYRNTPKAIETAHNPGTDLLFVGNKLVFSSREKSRLYVLDYSTRNRKELFASTRPHSINNITYSPKRMILTSSFDNICAVWDFDRDASLIFTIQHNQPITSLSISHDGEFLIYGDKKGGVFLFDMDERNAVQICKFNGEIRKLHLMGGAYKRYFAVSYKGSKAIEVYSLNSKKPVVRYVVEEHDFSTGITTFEVIEGKNGMRLVASIDGDNPALYVWNVDIKKDSPIQKPDNAITTSFLISDISVLPNKKHMAIACEDGCVLMVPLPKEQSEKNI